MKINSLFLFIRIVLGFIFIISGLEKLLQPYENFLYIVQSYEILNNRVLENMVAGGFPWIELILGTFLVLGLWTKLAVVGIWLMTTSFIIVVGQAIAKDLPLSSCGCFGDLIKMPLPVIVLMDATMWVFLIILYVFPGRAAFLSLDNYFLKKNS
ncbi:MAG: DoxX family protein [Candidatus Omnitrophota bacterium]